MNILNAREYIERFLMIRTKEGELVFLRKGVLSEADKEAFYQTIEKYR